jgi:hypothetical protein
MRRVLLCLLLLAAVPVGARALDSPPTSGRNLLRLHPGPWRLSAPSTLAGMRFEPEAGELAEGFAGTAEQRAGVSLRARAEADVRTASDGSRHAVLGGAMRAWTIATIDDQGRLVQDCVHGEAEARRRIETAAAARKPVRK